MDDAQRHGTVFRRGSHACRARSQNVAPAQPFFASQPHHIAGGPYPRIQIAGQQIRCRLRTRFIVQHTLIVIPVCIVQKQAKPQQTGEQDRCPSQMKTERQVRRVTLRHLMDFALLCHRGLIDPLIRCQQCLPKVE